MRTLLVPAAVAAILAASTMSFAAAATQHASGTVKSFDSKGMTLILADGASYVLPKTFKDPGLKAGKHISITWEKSGDRMLADQVTIIK